MYTQTSKTTYAFLFALVLSSGISILSNAQSETHSNRTKTTAKTGANTKKAAISKSILKPEVPQDVIITVRPQSEVMGGSFTLGEIADIRGGDKPLRDRLGAIQIGVSPLPGYSRTIWPGDVTVRLRSNKLDILQVKLDALPETKITRSSTSVEADEITKAALAAGQIAVKELPDASVELVQAAQKIVLPKGKLLVVTGAYQGSPESGSITIPITMMLDGKTIQSVSIGLKVRRKARVLLAKRAVNPHEILTADDVYLSLTQLPAGFTQPCIDLKEAVGKRTKRNLIADQPISAVSLEMPPAISSNDKITIEWVFGTVRITAPGISHQTGFVGDTIHVYATDTKKELDAVIVDSRTVRIVDSSDTASK